MKFDAKELERIRAKAGDAEYERLRGEHLMRRFELSRYAGLLAVAAHVRAMTLREAIEICDKEFMRFDAYARGTGSDSYDHMAEGARSCRKLLIDVAADATGKDGAK